MLVRFPFREAATGSGRHRQPSPHRGREAQALAPGQAISHIWITCLTLPHGECGQNRLNSVGQFCLGATKLTLHSNSLLRQGDPWTPQRLRKKSGPTASPPEFFPPSPTKGQALWTPPAPPKNPGTQPWIFRLSRKYRQPENVKTIYYGRKLSSLTHRSQSLYRLRIKPPYYPPAI